MGLLDFLIKRKKDAGAMNFYEFCPRCEANLTLQKGYDNNLSYWVCKGCGEMLINPRVETDTDIAWICDECESMLNEQPGFTEDCGKWKCTECGFVNVIDDSNLYLSDEEYQSDLHNPYKGMSDEELLEIMSYEEVAGIGGREDVVIVANDENLYVKKILSTYDESIYRYFMNNVVRNMPQIYGVYKSNKYLFVIEQYIKGITLDELIKEDGIEPKVAVGIVREVCFTLKELHNLDKPVIHRDIKPSNVMITEEGEVFLLDINVAKWRREEETEDTRLLGTPQFAAPEQFGCGFMASTEKTDIYAVGVLLNVLLTGKLPKEKQACGYAWDIIKKCICMEP
ncbi:MAG: protein kinase, partial [Lachnospiraceae bacterium]|nr:protein kinase [Lachnospiraceae bacterium]